MFGWVKYKTKFNVSKISHARLSIQTAIYKLSFVAFALSFSSASQAQSGEVPTDVPCIIQSNGSFLGDCPIEQPFQTSGVVCSGQVILAADLEEVQ